MKTDSEPFIPKSSLPKRNLRLKENHLDDIWTRWTEREREREKEKDLICLVQMFICENDPKQTAVRDDRQTLQK